MLNMQNNVTQLKKMVVNNEDIVKNRAEFYEYKSTSIICKATLLDCNNRLEKVVESFEGFNKYYRILETNIAIMCINNKVNILLDNEVDVYNENDKCSLPKMLSESKYNVYQKKSTDENSRD